MEKRLKILAGVNGVALVASIYYVLFALLYIFQLVYSFNQKVSGHQIAALLLLVFSPLVLMGCGITVVRMIAFIMNMKAIKLYDADEPIGKFCITTMILQIVDLLLTMNILVADILFTAWAVVSPISHAVTFSTNAYVTKVAYVVVILTIVVVGGLTLARAVTGLVLAIKNLKER